MPMKCLQVVVQLSFVARIVSASNDVCQIAESSRRDCHHGEGDCQKAGCCWKPVHPNPNNSPWCFFSSGPIPTPAPTPPPSPPPPPSPQCKKISEDERVDCQQASAEACQSKGCCWGPLQSNPDNLPWCYFQDKTLKACTLNAKPQVPFSADEINQVRQHFAANLDIQGSGMVVAAPDHHTGPGGDYYFAWMRDGALSMNAFMQTSEDSPDFDTKLEHWLAWVEKSQNQPDPHGISILAEPKFEIPSGKPFSGGWCRPQNDGPGLRAITLMALSEKKPSLGLRAWNTIKADLDWIATNYTMVGCDLWEEVKSDDFFWNRFTMRKALLLGSKFANSVGKDAPRAASYATLAGTITKSLSSHVQPNGFVCESTNRCTDTASIEAFNVGFMDDDVFAPLSKEVVATLSGLSKAFCRTYQLNVKAANAGVPGVLFGRYPGDSYDGGNPWILLTASAAHLLYRQSEALSKGSHLDSSAATQLEQLLGAKVTPSSLLGAGDAILLFMKKYLTNGMHMNEQIDRNDGTLKSAKDLTWNYANVLKAMKGRVAAEDAIARSSIVTI